MTKIRVLLLIITFLVVGIFGTLISLYAKGYRLNLKTLKLSPNGLLVIKSQPEAAQLFVNGELKTATNANLSLSPGVYDVTVKKEGFWEWKKRLTIEKEIVTEGTAQLFKQVPSLAAVTFWGVTDLTPSPDMTKIAFIVPVSSNNKDKEGLWIIETVNLPLGFTRDPRRITDGNLSESTWVWSPDGRQILLTISRGTYLLDTGSFTPQSQRVNVAATYGEILTNWHQEKQRRLSAQMRRLPDDLSDILTRKAEKIVFSPDEDMVLYTASGSASIPTDLIKKLPGASTQDEEREIKDGRTYAYDIKEDRNFFISEGDVALNGWIEYQNTSLQPKRSLAWYPSSRHLILAEEGKITIMDYDGTNKQVVYSGSYVIPHAYPTLSLDRLLILTNLGGNDTLPNLYSLSLK